MKNGVFSLLIQRRFGPFFFTQFFGAFNDNVFRQALIILITSGAVASSKGTVLTNLALALFIVPFFLFSAIAGQVADKYDKDRLLRRIKFAEVMIMIAASFGFFVNAIYFLLAVLFLTGLQATFFGPVKYSIIPRHLDDEELVSGNALVEMGTFLAILLGSISGVVLKMNGANPLIVSGTLTAVAVVGYLSARAIPSSPASDPGVKLNWNLWNETWRVVAHAREIKSVWISVIGISWFWFLGAAYTTELKIYVDRYLHGTDGLYALLLSVFSVGIGVGSFLCGKLSRRHVELGLVPLGSLGLSLFGIDLFFSYAGLPGGRVLSILPFMQQAAGLRVMLDLAGIGVFGGFYIVPLFAFIQHRADPRYLSRIIAANNILNALFMVAAAVAGIVLIGILSLTLPQFFLILAVANLAVAAYLYSAVPDFWISFLAGLLARIRYRVKAEGLSHIPHEGPALLICHPLSDLDPLLVMGLLRRAVRFVVAEPMPHRPLLNRVLRDTDAIHLKAERPDYRGRREQPDEIRQALNGGELLCVFLDVSESGQGGTGMISEAIGKYLDDDAGVPVIPAALSASYRTPLGQRVRWRLRLTVGEALPAPRDAEHLRRQLAALSRSP